MTKGTRSPLEDEASRVYDQVFAHRGDQGFYDEVAAEYGGPILEVGCGTGRVLLPIAAGGFEILGIDPNGSRVALCRQQIAEAGLSSHAAAEVGDIRTYSSARRFNLITSPFRSLQHLLTPADQQQALETAHAHLHPGGRFVIDVFNPSIPMLADEAFTREFGDGLALPLGDGRTVELRNRIVARDHVAQLQHAEEIYVFTDADGRESRVTLPFSTRYTFRYEWEHLAALVGFEVEQVYGGYDRRPFGAVYPGEILMVLRRP